MDFNLNIFQVNPALKHVFNDFYQLRIKICISLAQEPAPAVPAYEASAPSAAVAERAAGRAVEVDAIKDFLGHADGGGLSLPDRTGVRRRIDVDVYRIAVVRVKSEIVDSTPAFLLGIDFRHLLVVKASELAIGRRGKDFLVDGVFASISLVGLVRRRHLQLLVEQFVEELARFLAAAVALRGVACYEHEITRGVLIDGRPEVYRGQSPQRLRRNDLRLFETGIPA